MAVARVLMTADAVGGVWSYSVNLIRAAAAKGLGYTVAALGPAPSPEQAATLRDLGVELHHRPYRLEWMPGVDDEVEQAGAWLQDLAADVRPDIVHLNGFSHGTLPFPCPTLLVEHSCVLSWWRAVKGESAPAEWNRYRASVRAGLCGADALVAPTHAIASAIHHEHRISRDVQVIPNGVLGDSQVGAHAPVLKEPLVFSAGRVWDPAKSIDTLAAVASMMPWPVVVAGDAAEPGRPAVTLTGVRVLGPLPAVDVRRWLARAAIYAAPARYEPFGLSVLEAAREGCALVLGDIPSLRELWDGAALFVAPGDRRGLAAAIGTLAADQATREALAARARRRARRFTATRMAAAYAQLYARLSAPPTRHAPAAARTGA